MYALNRVLIDVHELHVRLVKRLIVPAFKRHSSCAKAMVFWDEFLGDDRVVDALSDLVRDKVREEFVRCFVRVDVIVVAEPLSKTGGRVEVLPVGLSLCLIDAEDGGGIRLVDEAGIGVETILEYGWVAPPDVFHVRGRNFSVAEWCGPIWCALEDCQAADGLLDLLDCLNCGSACADDADSFTSYGAGVCRPASSVE